MRIANANRNEMEELSGVPDGPGQGADLVQRRSVCDKSVSADAAVGGLDADGAAQ